jgi:hypothetical protein
MPELQNVIDRALERRRLARSNRELLEHLRRTQEELERRRAAELSQVRRIGEALSAPLTWDQLFNGLSSLIWESLPLQVLGLEAVGPGEPRLRVYRHQPEVAEASLEKLKEWVKWQFRAWQEGSNIAPSRPAPKFPLPSVLWEKIRVGEVLAVVSVGRDQPFASEEAELFRIFVLQGEAALKNLVLFEKVKSLAIRDALTGLYKLPLFHGGAPLRSGKGPALQDCPDAVVFGHR